MEAALKHKANILDINSSLQDVAMALDNKANTWDLDSKIVSIEYELYGLVVSFLKYGLFTHI
jgi:hypothetical protein